jgi:hypothetical protein
MTAQSLGIFDNDSNSNAKRSTQCSTSIGSKGGLSALVAHLEEEGGVVMIFGVLVNGIPHTPQDR